MFTRTMTSTHQSEEATSNVQKSVNGTCNVEVDVKTEEEEGKRGFLRRLFHKLQINKELRRKYILATSLVWAYGNLGWTAGQFGPAFLDLQRITDTGIDKGSLLFTFNSFGYLVGSLFAGFVYDKIVYAKSLIMLLTQLGDGLVLLAIPWCTRFELMVFAYTLKGIFNAGFETCGNTYLIQVWRSQGAALIQALYFTLAVGSFLSPYAISPFLTEEYYQFGSTFFISESGNGSWFNVSNSSQNQEHFSSFVNSSQATKRNITMATHVTTESILYIGFSITAALTLTSAIPFCLLFLSSKCKREYLLQSNFKTENYPNYSRKLKLCLIIMMTLIMGLYSGIKDSVSFFLAAFTVKQLLWTKSNGTAATSVYWATKAFGRGAGTIIMGRFRTYNIVITLGVFLNISLIGFFLTAHFKLNIGVWISTALIGLSGSVIFPLLFTWMEEDIVRVTGKMSSILMIAASLGSTINPTLIGYFMSNYTPMSFSYILLIEGTLIPLISSLVVLITRKSKWRQWDTTTQEETNPSAKRGQT